MKNILCLLGFHSWRYIPAKEREYFYMSDQHAYHEAVRRLMLDVGMDDLRFVTVEIEIMDTLAYGYMKQNNFGGNERAIHTMRDEYWQNMIATVTEIKFVKTGIYNRGYQHPSDPEDWVGPYLSKEKTHKILCVTGKLYDMTWIEAIHVEKIMEGNL